MPKKQNRKQRRQAIYHGAEEAVKDDLNLIMVKPLTENQAIAFDEFEDHNLFLYGYAGTGKTFIALSLSFKQVMDLRTFDRVVIFRSVVPSRDMGFLPGSEKEKAAVYEEPYADNCRKLFERSDAYEKLKAQKRVEFYTTSFVRGITLDDCIIIIDEAQNMNAGELNSLLTRVGRNCKIIICGDMRQTDLNRNKEKTGLRDFMKIIQAMKSFKTVEFEIEDIVRSELVKEYIITRAKLEDAEEIAPLEF